MHYSTDSEPLRLVLGRLKHVKPCRNGYMACCPVPTHGKGRGDRNPSLSIGMSGEGQVLLRCHGGCSLDAILAAIELTQADLHPSKDQLQVSRKGRTPVTYDSDGSATSALLRDPKLHGGKVTDRYTYRRADGTLAFVVLRLEFGDGRGKTFPRSILSATDGLSAIRPESFHFTVFPTSSAPTLSTSAKEKSPSTQPVASASAQRHPLMARSRLKTQIGHRSPERR